jgi:hypothetical protein
MVVKQSNLEGWVLLLIAAVNSLAPPGGYPAFPPMDANLMQLFISWFSTGVSYLNAVQFGTPMSFTNVVEDFIFDIPNTGEYAQHITHFYRSLVSANHYVH